MINKSWPRNTRPKRRTRRWRSCPALRLLLKMCCCIHKKRSTPKFRWSNTSSSPLPGPSGVSSQRPNAGSLKILDCRPSDSGHVLSTKRKDLSEMEQGSPNKRSRTITSPRKKKCKTRRRTPLDGAKSRRAQPKGSSQAEEEKEERPEGEPDHSEEAACSCYSRPKQRCFPSESSSVDNSSQSEDEEPAKLIQAIDQLMAKYKVVEELAVGGYGHVFSGVRIEDNLPVALKLIQKSSMRLTVAEVNGTFSIIPLEVHLLTQVGAGPGSAGSIVTPRLLDWYDLGSEIVLVLEKPEPCVDLVEYIIFQNPSGIIQSEAKIIFRQLVEAAIEMNARGVFHRDIKPDNILIETGADEPKARFIDFGCGTIFRPGRSFVEPEGTPLYSPPEWFRCEPYTAGPTTVWQLGLVLFAMLFNRMPLISERTIGSMRAVHIPKRIGRECRDILKGCLKKDPEKRLTLENLRDHPWLNT